MPKILFIVSFPPRLHSSARFRIELYEKLLEEQGFSYDTEYFWNKEMYKVLYTKGNIPKKILGLLTGFIKRFSLLFRVAKYDYIFILRETTPIGPPFFERICSGLLRKKIIYDFDDAIWISQASVNNAIVKNLKAVWKVKLICGWAYKVSVGNNYLYNYAAQYSKNVILNPTCVDTKYMHNKLKSQHSNEARIIIGWTGSFSTLIHLNYVVDALQELEKKYTFDFLVIADQNPHLPLKNFIYKKWEEDTEIVDLLKCNIGIMPLKEDEYAKGKCGFKLIQFMALGIPVVASPVGVNEQIVDIGINGFLCRTKQEWMESLEKLLLSTQLRQEIGIKGREKIEQYYSLESNSQNFLSLFS
jgi:glycosyltransferase involved in cell wall biosynthesis